MCYYYSQLGTDEQSDFLIHMATALSTDHHAVQELIQQRPQASSVFVYLLETRNNASIVTLITAYFIVHSINL